MASIMTFKTQPDGLLVGIYANSLTVNMFTVEIVDKYRWDSREVPLNVSQTKTSLNKEV